MYVYSYIHIHMYTYTNIYMLIYSCIIVGHTGVRESLLDLLEVEC